MSTELDKKFLVQCGNNKLDRRGFDTEAEVFNYLTYDASESHEHIVFEQKAETKLFVVKPRWDGK